MRYRFKVICERLRVPPAPALAAFALALLGGTASRSQPPAADRELGNILGEIRPLVERHAGPLALPVKITSDPVYQERILGGDRGARTARTVAAYEDESGGFEDVKARGCSALGCPHDMEVCLIVVSDLGVRERGELRYTIAHELYHCVQFERGGFQYALPGWLHEGSAVWAGLEVAASAARANQHWAPYFTQTWSLFALHDEEVYWGVGLFGHLESRGVDVWQTLNRLFEETAGEYRGDDLMLELLLDFAGDAGSLLRTWPMGMERNSAAGPEWDTDAPVSARRPTTSLGAPAQATVGRATQYLFDLAIPSAKIVTFAVSDAYGAIRWGRETTDVDPGFKREYCLKGTCQCEDGSVPPGIQEVEGSAIVALTGYLTDGRVSAQVSDPPCNDQIVCSGGEGSFDPCLVGTWNLDAESLSMAIGDRVEGTLTATFDETGRVSASYNLRSAFDSKGASYSEHIGSAQGCAEQGAPGQFTVPGARFDENIHRDYDAQQRRYYNLSPVAAQMLAGRTFSYVCEEDELFVWGFLRFDRAPG